MYFKVRHVLVERDILTATKTPWLVRLLYAFQDAQHVYLAMEYVPGGDFRTLLNNSGVLKEEHARFYISEMFVAVNELHKLGYIHRDLKPEVKLCRMRKLRSTDSVSRISLWMAPDTSN
jgi:serine/threonine protein kinase